MSFYPCLRRLLASLILLGLLPGCSASGSAPPAPPSAAATLVEHAEYVHRAGAQHEQIWTNFWDPAQGFILFVRHGPALLYTHTTPLPGGTEVAPHTYMYAEGLDRLTDSIYLRYPLPETTVTAVALQNSGEQTAGLLFHEAFHTYQSEHFSQHMDARFIDDTLFSDPHVRALLQMRRKVLSTALTRGRISVSELSALTTLDSLLVESIGSAAVERLYQLEVIEGSAEFVGLRAQILSLPASSREVDLPASLMINLHDRLAQPPGSIQSASNLRLYAYGSGAASIFLLSATIPEYQQIIAKELLDQPVLSHLNHQIEPLPKTQLYAEYDYASWLAWANREHSTGNSMTLADFAALTPATLDIVIKLQSAAAATGLDVNFSSGVQGFSQPQAGSYMLPEPLSVSVHATNTSLLIEGPATHLMSPHSEAAELRLQIKVDSLPVLCAHNPDGTRILSCELDSMSLDWQGIQFDHQGKTSVQQRGQSLRIDVNEH